MRMSPILLAAVGLALAHPAPASPPGGRPSPPVVGGSPAERDRWNDAAAVYFGDVPGCTGTLIAPDVVLTAGHCIDGVDQVMLGEVDLDSEAAEIIPVAREVEHPNSFTTYDVGLLILERPSAFTPRVIATGCVLERYLDNGAPVAIVGWGAVDPVGEQYPDVLMEAESVITDVDCTRGRGCNASVSPNGEMGAGGDNVDSCFGDSGGPLYLLTDIGDFLVGVTSRGYDDVEQPCGEGGIYVRPDAVLDWIEAETGQSIPRATCNAPPAPSADVTQLEVEAGDSVTATLAANDPDADDTHTYEVATEPMHGSVSIDEAGVVEYTASDDYDGPDEFTVRVADSGVPSLSGEVAFEVTVLPGGGCGCRSSARDPGAAVLLVLAALGWFAPRRRRRR
jgi:MYXO-CTERM domain-containing protein